MTENTTLRPVSVIYLGRLGDLWDTSRCVPWLEASHIPVITISGRCYIKLGDVSRTVSVLQNFVDDDYPLGWAAFSARKIIDRGVRDLLLVDSDGIPVRYATREETIEFTGGYYPE